MTAHNKDTYAQLGFRDIRDNVVVTDTHLVGILMISGVNLFEMQESQARAHMIALGQAMNLIGVPVQLVTHSRPKQFDPHISEVRSSWKKNDFNLEFEKTREYFDIKYEKELKSGVMMKQDIDSIFDRAPSIIKKSMLDSYVERLDYVVSKYEIKEKRYYFVISSLKAPEKIDEDKEQDYPFLDFTSENVYESQKKILDENARIAADHLREAAGLDTFRLEYDHLTNLMYDGFNFPESYRHQFNPSTTEYGVAPDILSGGHPIKDNKTGGLRWLSEQAINFVFSILSPSVATRSKNTPELRSNQILQVVKPFYLSDESMSYCRLNDQYLFTIHIDWFGSDYLEDLSLWPILTLPYDYDLSLHLIPLNKDLVLDQITKKIYSVEHNTAERQEKKALYEAERIEEKGSEEINGLSLLKANLTDRTTNLWSGSIDITFRAGSHKEMMEIKEVLTRKAGVNKILYSESTGHHIEGFISTLPLLQNHLAGYNRPYKRWEKLSQEVCHFYPYCPSAVQSKKGAILGLSVQWEGENQYRNVEFFDLFDRSRIINSNFVIIGNSGSGKTTFMHGFAKQQNLLGYRFLILDYLGNYDRWAKDMKDAYNVIRIDQSSNQKVNPCDIVLPSRKRIEMESSGLAGLNDERVKEKVINEKLAELSAYFRIFLEENYSSAERGILDKIAKKLYMDRLRTVSILPEADVFVGDIMLSHIVDALLADRDPTSKEWRARLAGSLEIYARGSFSDMFNQPTNIEIDNRNIVFLLRHNKDSKYKEIATLQVFLLVKQIAYRSAGNIIMIDELHEIFRMQNDDVQSFFRAQIAMIRNLDGGVIGMTQQFRQVASTQAGQEYLGMCEAKLYLAGWGIVQDLTSTEAAPGYPESAKLSEWAKRYLIANNRPGYGILRLGNDQIFLEIPNHPDLSMYSRYKPEKDY